jgi:hypothetical protein
VCLGFSKQKEIDMRAFLKQHFFSGDRDSQDAFARRFPGDQAADGKAIHLKKHQHLRLKDACGWAVHAMDGTVWITQDGNARDIILRPGESFVLDRDHTALLSSLNDDEVQVSLKRGTCPETAPRARRRPRPSLAM